jgi:DNA-binding CsgD family transcriptional regulator
MGLGSTQRHVDLIGRDDELRSAERFLDSISGGAAALVFQGEAGAGKTSLWEAALAAASERGCIVLAARPAEAEASFAYAALGDLLRPHGDATGHLPRPQRRALEIALFLAEEADEAPDQQAVALAALGVLGRLAESAAVLVAVDDVQWLDAASAAVLRYLTRRLGTLPVGLLLTVRAPPDQPPPLGLERSLPEERLVSLGLGPLSEGAIQRLLRTRLQLVPPRPTLHRLHALSGGNPFFALELGRALIAGSLRLERGERLPVSLEGLVNDRLATLGELPHRALAAAAALTQPEVGVVESAVDGGEAALAEAADAGVVELIDGRVRFTHPLLASGAYASTDPAERRQLHARLARLVSDPEERARHLALACHGPDEGVARELDAAAARAEGRGAPTAAAELYERAARLTPADSTEALHRRSSDAAYCLFQSGDSRRARGLLESVTAALPPGAQRTRALIRLARVRSYDDDQRAAAALFEQAIVEAGDDDALRDAAREGAAATLFRLRERLPEAVEHAAAAARSARERGDEALAAEALGSRLLAEAALGRPEAPATLDAALALQDATEHRRVLSRPLFCAGVFWLWIDELDRARDAFQRLDRACREMGDESSLPYVLVMLVQVECVAGELAAAVRHAGEGLALTQQSGQETLGAYLLALRATADAVAGDADHARERAARALSVAGRTSGRPAEQFARAALGQLELSLGRSAAADEALRPLSAFVRAEGIAEPGAIRFVPDHIESLIGTGSVGDAAHLLEWYEENAERLGRGSALAAAARCRGLLGATAGELEQAVVELERGLAFHGRAAIPLEHGRTLLALGSVHRRAKRKRAAREALAAALELLEGMGAGAWAQRARSELARIGGRAPSSGALTPTEQRVAGLVAEGLATKQVAAALFVSPKTVEGHLSRIYTKLGIHSRGELAHRLVERPDGGAFCLRSEMCQG